MARLNANDAGAKLISGQTLTANEQASYRNSFKSRSILTNPENKTYAIPLIAPSAWVGATSYDRGQVVSNGGRWYVCCVNGTSAASGGPTITTGDAQVDGTAYWTYLSQAQITSNDPAAPSISITTSGPSATPPTSSGETYTNIRQPVTNPGCYTTKGCTPVVLRTSFWDLKGFEYSSGNLQASGGSIEFVTDALEFAIFIPSNSANVRVLIDGRPLTVGGLISASQTGNDKWLIVDYRATGLQKNRVIEYQGSRSGNFYFGGWSAKLRDQVWATKTTGVRAVVIADSIVAGSSFGPALPGGSVCQRLKELLGLKDCWNLAIGGTGYINPGSSFYTYPQRVPQALALNPDLFILFGSTNDNGQPSASITAAALSTFQAIRAGSKNPIIVFGVWSVNSAAVTTENAIIDAVTAFADSNTFFIPIANASPKPWVVGSWNNGGDATAQNSARYVAGDAIHPPDEGTRYISERQAVEIFNKLNS